MASEVAKFEEMDAKAMSLLVSFISDQYLGCIRENSTMKEMWEALENTFAKKSSGRQMVLRNQIARLKLKEGTSLRTHLQQIEDLVWQLRVAGSKLEESDVCSALSLSLPESYDPLMTLPHRLPPPQLPTWQDCHELWSKNRRRQLREQQESSLNLPPGKPTGSTIKLDGITLPGGAGAPAGINMM